MNRGKVSARTLGVSLIGSLISIPLIALFLEWQHENTIYIVIPIRGARRERQRSVGNAMLSTNVYKKVVRVCDICVSVQYVCIETYL